ncbi:hypothetical protein LG198_13765 [Methylobacillus arboreus]|uniref:hypothetical protein n=1 Tax=Methylobacillus arboreus TaxID=755170 RepID=UPI001E5E24A5|nr:hypothetical protein [Methylobacillus arboreus]MCB5191801.1 hypothetical protein [Methylobacillus arboreus]
MIKKNWLEQNRFYYQIDGAKLHSIFYFILVWNIYEKELCGRDGKIRRHPKYHSEKYDQKVNQSLLDSVFNYFKNRYVLNGQPTYHFGTFEFNSEPIKSKVYGCLSSADPSNEEKLKALLFIAFRLINNLFHGEKQVEKLYEQNENFRQINMLLMNLIDTEKQLSRNQVLNELTTVSQKLGMGY